MNKVSYANLKLKINEDVNTFKFQGQTIEVLKYLNSSDKYDLVMITLQKAKEDGMYNPLKLDIFFHLHLVYMYTNLSFTDKQRENELKIYDCLKSNGFIDKMLELIDEDEYNELINWIDQIVEDTMRYKNSAAAVLQSLITDLPGNAEAAARIVDSFDPSQYQAVVDFATAANGGRPIMGTKKNQEI
ncbi:MAG: hypothetical protein LIO71_03035 [Ruminococcus sp.]|nr:hypothetical protein [Ruminococcus sp.]